MMQNEMNRMWNGNDLRIVAMIAAESAKIFFFFRRQNEMREKKNEKKI